MNRRTKAIATIMALVAALVVSTTTPSAAASAPSAKTSPPDVDVARVQSHLAQLQATTARFGNNRVTGTTGYNASRDYIQGKLQSAGISVEQRTCVPCLRSATYLTAEWPAPPPGPPGDRRVVVFGAHLDTVFGGPGINGNGSGAAVLLENALALARENPTMTKSVRFIWWPGTEQGLDGSQSYVRSLTAAQRAAITAYYNIDTVGSTNAGYFVDRVSSPTAAPLRQYWNALNLYPEENIEGFGRSDNVPFQEAGIPTSGYTTGAAGIKTSAQAAKWGGTANRPFDVCHHASCDTTTNIDPKALDRSADGIFHTIWTTAVAW
ncbi:M28 family peptidase [Embleya hyalina]|uniref:Hydrolase n=1 Tax=Embleya hyalina TaxID=516124 RepID=A0A401Z1I5_9ACTN|nr:M28 family peptidase [Embleya hyalina]GCE00734.1 hydrolase [Embleya hyalina]